MEWYFVGKVGFRVHKMIMSIQSNVSALIGAIISDIYLNPKNTKGRR